MKLIDVLIIYFACGAPFGVYQATTVKYPTRMQAALLIALRICFWPVFAVQTATEWLSKDHDPSTSDLDRQIGGIRSEMESIIFNDEAVSSVFDFREILNRYVGLSEAANAEISAGPDYELFELNNTANNAIASACLSRKNQRKLQFQRSLVRNEFIDMIVEFADTTSERERIMGLAAELAQLVNDEETARILTSSSLSSSPQTSGSKVPVARSRSATSAI